MLRSRVTQTLPTLIGLTVILNYTSAFADSTLFTALDDPSTANPFNPSLAPVILLPQ